MSWLALLTTFMEPMSRNRSGSNELSPTAISNARIMLLIGLPRLTARNQCAYDVSKVRAPRSRGGLFRGTGLVRVSIRFYDSDRHVSTRVETRRA